MQINSDFYIKAIEKLFLIVNKDAKTVSFKLNEPQLKILSELSKRDIILKARQEGISSLILAIFTLDFITKENVRCVVISHEATATQKLFDKVKFFLSSLAKTFPGEPPYKLLYNSRHEMVNQEKNSVFYIGTAGARAFGHGDTINNLHCSELSRWPDQEKLMVGLMQAVPKSGRIVIETTANGIGDYFYNLWKKSETPGSSFKTHFLPWYLSRDYSMPISDSFQLEPEEAEIQKTYNLTNEQMRWRRWKIAELGGGLDAFNEQFPTTAEEAFIVSGNPIWSPSTLKWYLRNCKPPRKVGNLTGAYQVYFDENPKGNLKIWEKPNQAHSYVIGADVAEGISLSDEGSSEKERDYSVAVVMDRNTAQIVATWHGHIDGDVFGRQLDLLGRFYNFALIGVEKNYQGLAPLMVLRDLNYPKIYYREKIGLDSDKMTAEMGWRTDRFTRPMMIDETSKWLRERRIEIYDDAIVGEMMSFVRYPDGQGRAAKNSFDDRVIALMIAIQMYIRNPITESGNEIEREDMQIGGGAGGGFDGGTPIDTLQTEESFDYE